MTQLLAGTSGYSYKEWLGHFYPEKLPANAMLRYYAERFSYDEAELRAWVERIAALDLSCVYVYFMHEDEALGTRFAQLLNGLWQENQAS